MPDALVIFHLIGLMLAISGAFGGTVVIALAKPAQKQKGGPLRGLGPAFAHVATAGVMVLWPSGIALMAVGEGDGAESAMFWMKLGFAGLLTFTTVTTEIIYGRARRGDAQIARVLPSLAPLAVLACFLVVIFSVLAFR
jgi:hypothetical protein